MLARPVDTARLEGNKAIVRRFVEAFQNRDLQGIEATMAPDPIRHSFTPDSAIRGLDAFKAFCQADWSTFPDSQTTITHMAAEGDLVAMYFSARCRHVGSLQGLQRQKKPTRVGQDQFSTSSLQSPLTPPYPRYTHPGRKQNPSPQQGG